MAKTTAKTAEKKAPAEKVASKSKAALLDKVCSDILSKLKTLDIEHQLQANLEWCLGSYSYDQNPTGLLENATMALAVFKAELAKKTKGVTAAFVASVEKALK
jgi:hypothetical protein